MDIGIDLDLSFINKPEVTKARKNLWDYQLFFFISVDFYWKGFSTQVTLLSLSVLVTEPELHLREKEKKSLI